MYANPVTRWPVAVGDLVVRPSDGGYAIFNYRGDRVLDRLLWSPAEAARVAADIVSPWQGRVEVDESDSAASGMPEGES